MLSSARHYLQTLSKMLLSFSVVAALRYFGCSWPLVQQGRPLLLGGYKMNLLFSLMEGNGQSWIGHGAPPVSHCHHLHSTVPTTWHEEVVGSRDQQ